MLWMFTQVSRTFYACRVLPSEHKHSQLSSILKNRDPTPTQPWCTVRSVVLLVSASRVTCHGCLYALVVIFSINMYFLLISSPGSVYLLLMAEALRSAVEDLVKLLIVSYVTFLARATLLMFSLNLIS